MCYYIGWSFDKVENIFYEEKDKEKIDKRLKQLYKMLAKNVIPFDYVFVKNNKALLKLSVFLPPKYDKMREKRIIKMKDG